MTITIRDGFSIALKILGFYFIYLTCSSLLTIGGYLIMLRINPQYTIETSGITKFAIFLPSVIMFILFIVGAYILLRFSDKIVERLVPVDKEIQIFGTDNWQKEVFILALRIFGAYQVINKITTLVWQIALVPTYQKAIEKYSWQNVIYTLVCIVVGLYLLTGAKHIVNLVFREKTIKPIDASTSNSGNTIPNCS